MQLTSRRGILGGAVLAAIGLPYLLQALGVPNSDAFLFVALGLAFLAAWYVGARPYVYAVPAAVLLAFGLGVLVPVWVPAAQGAAFAVFLGALALAFALVFVAHREHRVLLLPAAILALVALADLLGYDLPQQFQPYFVPIVLIAVGVYLLVEPSTH